MYYNTTLAVEVSRLVHEERLAAAEHSRLLHELELANRLEMKESPLQQLRKVMDRVMSLFL